MRECVREKVKQLKGLNEITLKGEIVVFGSTYMANFPFYELVNGYKLENAVYNRSIVGLTLDEAEELLEDCVLAIKPSKVFLAFGEKDAGEGNAIAKYRSIVRRLRAALPDAKLFLVCSSDEEAEEFNERLATLCDGKKTFLLRLTKNGRTQNELYKAQFKQLAHFFRNKPLSMADAFAAASL